MAERAMRCPICRRPLDAAMRAARAAPFCSLRCADGDLGRWLGEAYRLPGEAEETAPEGESPG
jgi:uncharacterized protein